jgi:catechol 2,3-dioxygenase-like lactoylglutathione lyase family enzyme
MSNRAPIGTIDHVVITVADLAASAEIYRRLGFTLSPKGVHSAALGTENHTIMLQDDYFELLAVRVPTDRNAAWRRAVAQGGGVAGMAMTTEDPHAARSHWLAAGLSPDEALKFARTVPRPDGSTMEARFEVVSLDEIPGTGMRLFVCSQPTREAVWLPELTGHANTAVAIRRIVIACPDLKFSAAQWLRALPGAQAASTAEGISLDTGRHHIDLVAGHAPQVRALGIDYLVADLTACRATLQRGGIAHEDEGASIHVAPGTACNVAIGFYAGPDRAI